MEHRHKPGPLKQQNKPHKLGKHQTKAGLSKRGRPIRIPSTSSLRTDVTLGRKERRNRANQIRKSKREQIIFEKRARGLSGTPPHSLLLVPMTRHINLTEIRTLLQPASTDSTATTFYCPRIKQRFTLCSAPYGELYTLLDLAKVCDSILFLFSVEDSISEWAEEVISVLMAQGLPTPLHAVTGLQSVPSKDRAQTRSAVSSVVTHLLPIDSKLFSLDTETEAFNLLRSVSEQKRRSLGYRDNHPYILCEESVYDSNSLTLSLSGYLRGKPLSPNQIVHLPGIGDFQISLIETQSDPCPFRGSRHGGMEIDTNKVRLIPDQTLQESLITEAEVDPMEGEQTWPSKEELKSSLKKNPSSWIADPTPGEDSTESESDGERPEQISGSDSEDHLSIGSERESDSAITETVSMDTNDYDKTCDPREEKEQLERIRAQGEDVKFPDERDTPIDQAARIRFGKYRGLQSFRTSPWDPDENLPVDYARIFKFHNFRSTQKRALQHDYKDGDVTGLYVTIHLKDFPSKLVSLLPSTSMVIFGLLQFEQKMSLIHFTVKRVSPCNEIVKSKDPMLLHMGCRRFLANPIYSQHAPGDKHKYELFFRGGGTYVASIYAPITFKPCPILMFTPTSPTTPTPQLLATGSVLMAGPDRIICKRIKLSGHPFKIHRRSAVIRYMFFNREDIMWFKPIQLRTKYGRVGNIKEPLGTHGHMKCTFDKQLKAQDTILMSLYKRVYPKWTYCPYLYQPTSDVTQGELTMETDRET
ncbi:pre-rRNA-processing protein TSR1-like [Oopsacas minuta]|uniref:Pre-rRNA-processing protein TSR1 homolog n=1 Tax=Oopsacas minuta TaxID=111878 RepID=A0AAV7KA66_9METZ|nr:pre-rRNA-processing protein TSR1-like [Oopsacas minuta]